MYFPFVIVLRDSKVIGLYASLGIFWYWVDYTWHCYAVALFLSSVASDGRSAQRRVPDWVLTVLETLSDQVFDHARRPIDSNLLPILSDHLCILWRRGVNSGFVHVHHKLDVLLQLLHFLISSRVSLRFIQTHDRLLRDVLPTLVLFEVYAILCRSWLPRLLRLAVNTCL